MAFNRKNTTENRQTDNKPKRVPVSGIRDILTVYGKESEFEYRFVVDTTENGSRIAKFKRGGWELAPAETKDGDMVIGEESVYKSDKHGSIVAISTGGGKHSYLMRIKKEWYTEDQEAKQDQIDEVEEVINRHGTADGGFAGQYGSVSIGRK